MQKNGHARNTSYLRTDICNGIFCVLLVLLACFLVHPIAEIAINDEPSYIRSAQDLAATGRIIYNGWAAAMLGAQLYWGALFALLFGKSYTAVRLSCVPLALFSTLLCYLIFRRSQIAPLSAVLGTLTVGLSPLFLPYAVTFMSEMPCLVLFLLTVYAYLRADDARLEVRESGRHNAFLIWLAIGTLVGVLSGTVRQINWILALLGPLLIAFRIWSEKKNLVANQRFFLRACLLSAVVVAGFTVGISRWFASQPYAILEHATTGVTELLFHLFADWNPIVRFVFSLFYTIVLITSPVLPLAIYFFWDKSLRNKALYVSLISIVLLLALQWSVQSFPPMIQFPWMDNTFTPWGVWVELLQEDRKTRPRDISPEITMAITVGIIALTTLLLANSLRFGYRIYRRTVQVPFPFALQLMGLFTAFYLPILVVKVYVPFSYGVFDRYLLPVLPGSVLACLYLGTVFSPEKPNRLCTVASISLVTLFGLFAVKTTHDFFVDTNGVRRVARMLETAGIPRTYINGGMAYNASTQLALTGYYNDSRIINPPDAYRPQPEFKTNSFAYWQQTPDVSGIFFITFKHESVLYDIAMPPILVASPITGRKRYLYVQSTEERFKGLTLSQIHALLAKAQSPIYRR